MVRFLRNFVPAPHSHGKDYPINAKIPLPFLAQRFGSGYKKITAGKILWWLLFCGYSVVHLKLITEGSLFFVSASAILIISHYCFPSGELTDVETTKAQFYLAIRSIIYKQTKGDAPDAEIMNRVVEEMVRNAIACTGIENIVDENKSVDLFSDEFIAELDAVKMPITKFNALLKLLRKAISSYGRTNKVKAQEFDERLRNVVEAYNSRDKLVFTSEVVADFVNDLSDQLLQILKDLQDDKTSFEKLGISFEEKAFYDILVKVRDDHGFPYADEKCLVLAKKIKKLVDDKAQFADWSTRDDIKNQLNMELTVLLYQNGYPPEWDEEVFEKVMEQAENFKKYSDK